MAEGAGDRAARVARLEARLALLRYRSGLGTADDDDSGGTLGDALRVMDAEVERFQQAVSVPPTPDPEALAAEMADIAVRARLPPPGAIPWGCFHR